MGRKRYGLKLLRINEFTGYSTNGVSTWGQRCSKVDNFRVPHISYKPLIRPRN
jgi:hypothetical protein